MRGKAGTLRLLLGAKRGRFAYLRVRMRFSEDKELHEDKGNQSRWWNCEKLSDQNVVRDRGEAEMDDRDRRQPTGEDDREVLHELPPIITSPALKYPEFVQQKMAGHTDKVGN
jgi:hypothetical protein